MRRLPLALAAVFLLSLAACDTQDTTELLAPDAAVVTSASAEGPADLIHSEGDVLAIQGDEEVSTQSLLATVTTDDILAYFAYQAGLGYAATTHYSLDNVPVPDGKVWNVHAIGRWLENPDYVPDEYKNLIPGFGVPVHLSAFPAGADGLPTAGAEPIGDRAATRRPCHAGVPLNPRAPCQALTLEEPMKVGSGMWWIGQREGELYTYNNFAAVGPMRHGFYTVAYHPGDDAHTVGTHEQALIVYGTENSLPILEGFWGPDPAQYSDEVNGFRIDLLEPDFEKITYDARYRYEGGSWQSGLPGGIDLGNAARNPMADGLYIRYEFWTESFTDPAGYYEIDFRIADTDGNALPTFYAPFSVLREDGSVDADPGNPVGQIVSVPGGDASLTVRFTASERQPDDPGEPKAQPGDVSLMPLELTLVPFTGTPLMSLCDLESADPVNDGYDQTATFRCDAAHIPVGTYTLMLDGSPYYRFAWEDVLTVYDPSLGFATGGGQVAWPGTGERTNFGLTVKYNKKGANVKGNVLVIRHVETADGDAVVRLKANALEGLAITEVDGRPAAEIVGKATFQDVGWEEAEGNYTFRLVVVDGDPDETDRFFLEVFDRTGAPVKALSTGGLLPLAGGNVSIPQGN